MTSSSIDPHIGSQIGLNSTTNAMSAVVCSGANSVSADATISSINSHINTRNSSDAPDLRLFSPAKINLFLHIIGRRANGYHDLQTVFRLIDWGDTLDFYLTADTFSFCQPFNDNYLPIRLSSRVLLTENPLDNLVVKAAIALLQWVQKNDTDLSSYTLPIIDILLHKNLPTGAGLGGGSSNAATTLQALNQLWGFNLSKRTLMAIGTEIGADVPIFLFGQDAIAEGIGERLSAIDLSASPFQYYLLLNPSLTDPSAHASTQALFTALQLKRDMPSLTSDDIIKQQADYTGRLLPPFTNVFEPVVTNLVPLAAAALIYLEPIEQMTRTTRRMTGSGSSVFLPISIGHIDIITQYLQRHPPPCDARIVNAIVK